MSRVCWALLISHHHNSIRILPSLYFFPSRCPIQSDWSWPPPRRKPLAKAFNGLKAAVFRKAFLAWEPFGLLRISKTRSRSTMSWLWVQVILDSLLLEIQPPPATKCFSWKPEIVLAAERGHQILKATLSKWEAPGRTRTNHSCIANLPATVCRRSLKTRMTTRRVSIPSRQSLPLQGRYSAMMKR